MSVSNTPIYYGKRPRDAVTAIAPNLYGGTSGFVGLSSTLTSLSSLDGIFIPNAVGDTFVTMAGFQALTNKTLFSPVITGSVTLPFLSTNGVVHNNSSGVLSSSLIVAADLDPTAATSNNSPNTIVLRDASGNFSATLITASIAGAASLNVLKSGDTMSGALSTTNLTVTGLNSAGVVHNSSAGVLSTRFIQTSDLDSNPANLLIPNVNIATLTTAGKVANSATTATSSNTPNTIILRDGSGNFSGGIFTGNINTTSITLPYPASAINSLQIGATGDFNGSTYGLGIAFPSTTSYNPFGIVLNNSGNYFNIFNVSNAGAVSTLNHTLDDGTGNTTFRGGKTILITNLTSIEMDAVIAGSSIVAGASTFFNTALIGQVNINTAIFGQTTNIGSTFGHNLVINGSIQTSGLNALGLIHTDASGNLSTKLLQTGDLDNSTNLQIPNANLITISTAGKVSNSATTATNLNTANAIVARDASGNFSAGTITATLSGGITGAAALNVLKSGDTMTGALTTTGLTVSGLSTIGIVHNSAAGLLSTKLIQTADLDNSTNLKIPNANLVTLSTASLVSNSATTATNLNTANAIVTRDGSGNFSAGTITATLSGGITGAAALNVLKAGDTMTGNLNISTSSIQCAMALSDSSVTAAAAGAGPKITFAERGQNLFWIGTAVSNAGTQTPTNDFIGFYSQENSATILEAYGDGHVIIPNKNLSFGQMIQNKIISLYDPFPSDNTRYDYFGFGISGNTLRYQVATSAANHIFYSSSTSSSENTALFTIGGNGVIASRNNTFDDNNGNLILSTSNTNTGLFLGGANSSSTAFGLVTENGHDNTQLWFDMYFNGTNLVSTSSFGSFRINKSSSTLLFQYGVITAGSAITVSTGLSLTSSGILTTNHSTLDDSNGNMNLKPITAKATTNLNVFDLTSSDVTLPYQLQFGWTGNATSSLVTGVIQSVVPGGTYNPLQLNPGGGSVLTRNNTLDDALGNMIINGTSITVSNYCSQIINGGNSRGAIWGNFAVSGYQDSVNFGYNWFPTSGTVSTGTVYNTGGATSLISTGYGGITLKAGGVNAAPVSRFQVSTTGVTTYNSSGSLNNTLDDGSGNMSIAGNLTVSGTLTNGSNSFTNLTVSGNITQTGTGTLSTATGNISLNGATQCNSNFITSSANVSGLGSSIYSTGQAWTNSATTTSLIGVSTGWTSVLVNGLIQFGGAGNTLYRIVSVNSTTSITLNVALRLTSLFNYQIFYNGILVDNAGDITSQPIKSLNTAKVWVCFDNLLSIKSSFNVSSVTKTSTGKYYVNYATQLSNDYNSVNVSCPKYDSVDDANCMITIGSTTNLQSHFGCPITTADIGHNLQDCPYYSLTTFGPGPTF